MYWRKLKVTSVSNKTDRNVNNIEITGVNIY